MFIKHQELLKTHGKELGPLKTLYIGGGTPNLWSQTGCQFLKEFLNKNNLSFEKDYEFTIEVNPGKWSEDQLQLWQNIGVNRCSVGIQTLNPNCLKALDRIHSVDESKETLFVMKKNKVNFSVDLMLGIPDTTVNKRSIMTEIETLLEYGPSHFSVYILTVPKSYKHFDLLPEESFVHDEFLMTSEILKKHGYHHYEVSNYARPGFESVHNSAYWDSESVAALGPSATGFLQLTPDRAIRYKWKNKILDFDIEELNAKQLKLERTYLALRTKKGVLVESLTHDNSLDSLNRLVARWNNFGYLDKFGSQLSLTSKGFLMMDSLLQDIFRHTDLFDS
jgi:oxygen-independent coproporphyrinogen-3 oxidase